MVSGYTLHEGDCLEVVRSLPDASVDAVVTDPPYALAFMSKAFDTFASTHAYQAWCQEWATECLRLLRPGGHLLAFGGTRTYHRLACAIEDAGFEIRDSIRVFGTEEETVAPAAYLYGSGFPKSMSIGKAIDKMAGAKREVVGRSVRPDGTSRTTEGGRASTPFVAHATQGDGFTTAPATDAARQWEGFGTALKPAHEPIVVARKPLIGTVAANVLEHGVGGLNIDGCRVEGAVPQTTQGASSNIYGGGKGLSPHGLQQSSPHTAGRWPPNVVLTHAPTCEDGACDPACPVRLLDEQSGVSKSSTHARGIGKRSTGIYGEWGEDIAPVRGPTDSGGASRFFYTAKASTRERTLPDGTRHTHPTTKPLSLMRWLVRLVTPPHGVVLDPFMGSATTGVTCLHEGFRFIGIEREPEYMAIARQRMAAAAQPSLGIKSDSTCRDQGDENGQ